MFKVFLYGVDQCGQVVIYDLCVIQVQLYQYVWVVDVVDQVQCLMLMCDEIVGYVVVVDWFQQDGDVGIGQQIGGKVDIVDIGCFCCGVVQFCCDFGYGVQLGVVKCVGIIQCYGDIGVEFILMVGQGGKIVFFCSLVVWWYVEQCLFKFCGVQVICDFECWVVIGEQVFYCVKVCICRCFEVVQKGVFGEYY